MANYKYVFECSNTYINAVKAFFSLKELWIKTPKSLDTSFEVSNHQDDVLMKQSFSWKNIIFLHINYATHSSLFSQFWLLNPTTMANIQLVHLLENRG